MPKTKRYLPFPLFLLTLLVVSGGLWYVYKTYSPAPVDINEVTATGTVTLHASPPTSPHLNQNFTLDINTNSGANHITAVQLELEYDPAKLQVISFIPTDYLSTILTSTIIAGGKVTATLGAPPDSGGRADWGTVGKITLKPLTLGTTTINFGPNNLVSTIESSTNALQITEPIILIVFNVGDINHDKIINLYDYNFFVRDYGLTGYSWADLNNDSKVDLYDYNLFVANYGKTSP